MAGGPSHSKLQTSFGILLEDTLRRTDRLEQALTSMWRQFSGAPQDRGYRFFIDALRLANEGARELIRELRTEFTVEDAARSGNYDDLTSLASNLDEFLERYLPLLHRPRSDELEVFATPFTRVVKRLIPNVELLFFTWSVDGYRAISYDFETLKAFDPRTAKNLRQSFGADIKFVQLLHPMLREADPFHFAVFAHEIAHITLSLAPSAWEFQLEDEAEEEAKPESDELTPDASKLSFLELVMSELKMPELELRQEEQLISWFEESACDIFAMRLIGPVFALAYAEVTSANRPLEPEKPEKQRDHPPPRLRFKVLAEELERFRLGRLERTLRPKLKRYMESYLDEVDEEPFVAQAEPWLDSALDKLREMIGGEHGALRGQEYESSRLKADLPAIFDLADRDVPPAERLHVFEDASVLAEVDPEGPEEGSSLPWSEPFDWRSILNGMLLWHLHHWGLPPADLGSDLGDAEARAEHRSNAARLAIGGVELSEFHRRADRQRTEMRVMCPVDLGEGKQ